MFTSILLQCLLISLSVSYILAFVPPEALVEPLKPRGIRISIPDEEGITLVAFHVKFNDEFMGLEAGSIARDIVRAKNDRWTYQDKTTKLKKGDVIYYWIHVVYEGLGYNLIGQEHVVTEFFDIDGQKVEPSGNNNSGVNPYESNNNSGALNGNDSGKEDKNSDNQSPPCANPSKTKLYYSFGKSRNSCTGDLIFEEDFKDFSTFNDRWAVLTQFSGSPDYEFVVYRNSPYNLQTGNGLKITPTLLKNEFGERFIRTGDWNLQSCTEAPGSIYCHRKARGWNVLPPIASARINTKTTFNFQYGRVEVRARFPYGDWIYPLILLEPVHNDKGSALEFLQIRVASSSGNYELKLTDGQNFGGQILWGGVTGLNPLQHVDRLNEPAVALILNNELWANNYHTYELTWSPNEIILKVDGQIYGQKQVSLPESTPFYLTFGAAVGGLSEFPDQSVSHGYAKPWRNLEAKALHKFLSNINTLSDTWQYNATSFDVDYVKVYAL